MSETSTTQAVDDYELRDEYDLTRLRVVAKGRYDPAHRLGRNVVVLDQDVSAVFPTDEAVNQALRLVIQLAKTTSGNRELHEG